MRLTETVHPPWAVFELFVERQRDGLLYTARVVSGNTEVTAQVVTDWQFARYILGVIFWKLTASSDSENQFNQSRQLFNSHCHTYWQSCPNDENMIHQQTVSVFRVTLVILAYNTFGICQWVRVHIIYRQQIRAEQMDVDSLIFSTMALWIL